jgi:hypothetical protein
LSLGNRAWRRFQGDFNRNRGKGKRASRHRASTSRSRVVHEVRVRKHKNDLI